MKGRWREESVLDREFPCGYDGLCVGSFVRGTLTRCFVLRCFATESGDVSLRCTGAKKLIASILKV